LFNRFWITIVYNAKLVNFTSNKVYIDINEGWIYLLGISSPSSITYGYIILAFANTEHLCATIWAYTLCGWFSILHGYCFGVFHFPLGTAFHTIGFHDFLLFTSRPSYIKIHLPSNPFLSSDPDRPSNISGRFQLVPGRGYSSSRATRIGRSRAVGTVS
jgi:hypothetical protein